MLRPRCNLSEREAENPIMMMITNHHRHNPLAIKNSKLDTWFFSSYIFSSSNLSIQLSSTFKIQTLCLLVGGAIFPSAYTNPFKSRIEKKSAHCCYKRIFTYLDHLSILPWLSVIYIHINHNHYKLYWEDAADNIKFSTSIVSPDKNYAQVCALKSAWQVAWDVIFINFHMKIYTCIYQSACKFIG